MQTKVYGEYVVINIEYILNNINNNKNINHKNKNNNKNKK